MSMKYEEQHSQKVFSSKAEECILTLKNNISLVYSTDYKQFLPYCEQLLSFAIEEQSDYLFALSYYYMMLFYSADNNYINTISCALEGIKYQQKVQSFELVARSYNTLGSYTASSGDVAKSVEYLLCGIDCCKNSHLDYEHGMLAANLAHIFQRNSNFDRALYYYEEAERFYDKMPINNDYCDPLDTLINLYCNKCFCLLSLRKTDELELYTQKLSEQIETAKKKKQPVSEFITNTYFATYYHSCNKMDKMITHFKLAQENIQSAENYMNCMDDIKAYLDLYRKLGLFDELIVILDTFIEKCEQDNAPFNILSYFITERIEYTKLLNDMDTYVLFTQKFLDLFKSEQNKNSDSSLQAEKSHKEYNRIQKQQKEMYQLNEKLMIESQHDPLTTLPNRAYFNSYAEDALSEAIKKRVPFGIEILDIDHFKQINDTYGHMTGDKYLVALADQLLRIMEEYSDVFVARYGGDEFVVIYYNKTTTEVRMIMDKLKNYTSSIKLPDVSVLGVNFLTLSQGCCNVTPSTSTRIKDYISSADISLYDVKVAGRNNYMIHDYFHSET